MRGGAASSDRPVLRFEVDERPRPLESLLYGWQHTLVDISPFVLPLPIAAALGLGDAQTAAFISYGLIAMGLATLLQTTIGNRLPIVQGPSATLVGTMVPLASASGGPAMWGGLFVGGLIESMVGATRLVGLLRRFLPPRVCGTLIVVIGLSLAGLALRLSLGDGSPRSLGLALTVIVVVFVLQNLPRWMGRDGSGGLLGLVSGGAIFFAIWGVGVGLGSLLGAVDWALVASRPWIALPRLFPFDGPGWGWQFPLAATMVILVGYLASMVESIGDYAATCQVAGVEYTEKHMNRGIFAEGLGGMLCASLGAVPCTSYTQNIGILATTRVASRFVVQVAAVILVLYGLCPKFGALLVAIPRPVLGGVFVLVCGMIVMSGLRLLAASPTQESDGWVVGVTLAVSLALPAALNAAPAGGALATRVAELPLAAELILTNSIVLAVLVGSLLERLMSREDEGRTHGRHVGDRN